VLIGDSKIANRSFRSPQRAYIIGSASARPTSCLRRGGQQIASYESRSSRDLNGVRAALKQTLPNAESRSKASAKA